MASKVYFTTFRATPRENLPQKLARLVKKAGILDLDFENRYTAIKIHFGEPGNLAYLRPNYAKVIVDIIKDQGGRVFLTDCNTLYVGRRKNGLDHLEAAYENGYNPFTTGAHVVIADGIKGTDEVLVPIEGDYVLNNTVVKVVTDVNGNAIYFSRSPIPYPRHAEAAKYFEHVGIYAYTHEFLNTYTKLAPTPLSEAESLEQLKVLEHGYKIKIVPAPAQYEAVSVDTEEDLQEVIRIYKERHGC